MNDQDEPQPPQPGAPGLQANQQQPVGAEPVLNPPQAVDPEPIVQEVPVPVVLVPENPNPEDEPQIADVPLEIPFPPVNQEQLPVLV